MTYRKAFESFMDEAFEDACTYSTTSSWSGNYYVVELFEDGAYRTLPTNSIGNRYDSPGIMLTVPPVADNDWDADPDVIYFDNAAEEMRIKFEDALEALGIEYEGEEDGDG